MKKRPLVVMLLAVFCFAAAYATDRAERLSLTVGVMGESLVHPGVFLTASVPLYQNESIAVPVILSLRAYDHPRNHAAITVCPGIGVDFFKNTPFVLRTGVFSGFLVKLYNAPVYHTAGDSGPFYGKTYPGFVFGGNLDLGWRIGANRIPLSCTLSFWEEYPVNSHMLPHVSIGIDTTFAVPMETLQP